MSGTLGLRVLSAAVALVLLAGCGVRSSGVIVGSSPPSGLAAPDEATTLYLLSEGRLVPVPRPGAPLSRAEALALLAQGPTSEERARGLTTEVPPEAAPFSVTLEAAERVRVLPSPHSGELSATALDQITCTAADGGQVRFPDHTRALAACPIPG
ncbi:hypothetical protein [Saccharopolyspora gloriosae]|uniref:hypothetical protein n=1 Tax=Saccharopolyspora gloriosae TaxID=455344 RepID=UPI001FB77FBA|nr:hypothetical protein [Saccharopolyspora gloriosae]